MLEPCTVSAPAPYFLGAPGRPKTGFKGIDPPKPKMIRDYQAQQLLSYEQRVVHVTNDQTLPNGVAHRPDTLAAIRVKSQACLTAGEKSDLPRVVLANHGYLVTQLVPRKEFSLVD